VTLPLATERLLIREFQPGDLDGLAALYGDPAVLWWEPEPYSRERTTEALAHILELYRLEGTAEYAVCLAASGEVIGDCGPVFRDIDGERLPELGWDLRSDHWGHGYATEAARGVLTHAGELGLCRLYSLITPTNERSRRVAEKLGMTIERQVVWADRPHDLWTIDLR